MQPNAFQNFFNSLNKGNPFAQSGSSTIAQSTPSVTPSSPSAVAPAKATPAVPVTPAKAAYTASITQPATQSQTPVATPTAPAVPTTPGSTATTPAATLPNQTPSYVQAYQDALAKYTASLAPSTTTTAAATNLADIQNTIDQKTLDAKQQYQNALDTPGMLKAGAQDAATQLDRRNNANLANLAVQEGGAARTLTALQGTDTNAQTAAKNALDASKPLQIGNSYYDTTTGKLIPNTDSTANAPFTLSAGQTRYDASGKPIATASSATSGIIPVTNNDGTTTNVPLSVAPYYNTTDTGHSYMDASTIQGTATEKAQAIQDAQNAGIKVITNKNSALDLTNINDANAKLDTVSQVMAGIAQPDALSRDLYGMGLTYLATKAQSDPQKAAAGALQSIGLDILKAISGVQGFRGNSAVVQQVTDHLPSVYDTQATIDSKVKFIKALVADRENSILGLKSGTGNADVSTKTVDVSTPDGAVHTFPDQKSADAFKKAANLP